MLFFFLKKFLVFFKLAEFNPIDAPKLSEKVLKDKRKKLKETFQRVIKLYVSIVHTFLQSFIFIYLPYIWILHHYWYFFQEKENPDLAKDLQKQEVEYDRKREKLQVFYGTYLSKVVSKLLYFWKFTAQAFTADLSLYHKRWI